MFLFSIWFSCLFIFLTINQILENNSSLYLLLSVKAIFCETNIIIIITINLIYIKLLAKTNRFSNESLRNLLFDKSYDVFYIVFICFLLWLPSIHTIYCSSLSFIDSQNALWAKRIVSVKFMYKYYHTEVRNFPEIGITFTNALLFLRKKFLRLMLQIFQDFGSMFSDHLKICVWYFAFFVQKIFPRFR